MENESGYYEEPRTRKYGAWGCRIFYQEAFPKTVSAAAHTHDILELIRVEEGSFHAVVNGREYYLEKGSEILFCSREIHRIYAGECEKNGYYVIKIDPSVLYDYALGDSNHKYILPFAYHREGRKCFFTRREALEAGIGQKTDAVIGEWKGGKYASELMLVSECMGLLVSFLRYWNESGEESDAPDADACELIYKALEYIHKNFCSDITAADCCRYVGLSYSYFSRLFKKVVGKGFSEYVNYLRCSRAEKLLLTTGKSVSEISAECGFSDTGYFIQRFKKERGVTPACLRRRLGTADADGGL